MHHPAVLKRGSPYSTAPRTQPQSPNESRRRPTRRALGCIDEDPTRFLPRVDVEDEPRLSVLQPAHNGTVSSRMRAQWDAAGSPPSWINFDSASGKWWFGRHGCRVSITLREDSIPSPDCDALTLAPAAVLEASAVALRAVYVVARRPVDDATVYLFSHPGVSARTSLNWRITRIDRTRIDVCEPGVLRSHRGERWWTVFSAPEERDEKKQPLHWSLPQSGHSPASSPQT